jgi:hypothetical protein
MRSAVLAGTSADMDELVGSSHSGQARYSSFVVSVLKTHRGTKSTGSVPLARRYLNVTEGESLARNVPLPAGPRASKSLVSDAIEF